MNIKIFSRTKKKSKILVATTIGISLLVISAFIVNKFTLKKEPAGGCNKYFDSLNAQFENSDNRDQLEVVYYKLQAEINQCAYGKDITLGINYNHLTMGIAYDLGKFDESKRIAYSTEEWLKDNSKSNQLPDELTNKVLDFKDVTEDIAPFYYKPKLN